MLAIASSSAAGLPWRLTAARAIAWALLLAGWVGLGGIALSLTPSLSGVHAIVAAWLLALGIAATVATRDSLIARWRRVALLLCAVLTAGALIGSTHEGALPMLMAALCGWAALTALASGVVRSLRLARTDRPRPPITAASLGALAAAVVLSDPGHAQALATRLAVLVLLAGVALALLQPGDRAGARASRCRAGLFDCSLPAWPAGAWRDAAQWPALLAGLAMLPMMAALPLMALWCRTPGLAPQAMVALHFAAMFVPALMLRHRVAGWSTATLAAVCTLLMAGGAALVLWLPAPFDLLAVAMAQGAAWSLAWTGQLWAPERRAERGASPLRAAMGYAALTLVVGWTIEQNGARGLALVHGALGVAAALAWGYGRSARRRAIAG